MIISPTQHFAEEQFSKYDLADVLFSLNRACCAAQRGTLNSDLPIVKATGSDQRIFLWAAAETARLALRWCRAPAFDRSGNSVRGCTPGALDQLVALAIEVLSTDRLHGSVEARLQLEQGDFLDSVLRIIEPQHLLQRQSQFRAAQAMLMYGEAASRRARRDPWFSISDHHSLIESALGCSIESFVLALQQVLGKSQGSHPLLTANSLIPTQKREYDSTELYAHHESGLITPAAGAVLDRLSGTPAAMVRWMDSELGRLGVPPVDARPLLEAPSPLHRFPLVSVFRDKPDHCIAPVPHLIDEWLYEPLAAYLYGVSDSAGKQRLNLALEEYIGMLLEIGSPDSQPWLHEDRIKPIGGGKVIDWVREFDDTVVLVDAKRAFIGLGERYRSLASDWKTTFEKNWGKAIGQATAFWNAVQQQKVPLLRHCSHKRPLLLVATLSDTDWRAGHLTVHASLSPYLPLGGTHVPFAILSIDRLERIISTWETKTPEWLPQFLDIAIQQGTTTATRTLTPTSSGKLSRTFAALFDRLKVAVNYDDSGSQS